MQLLSWFWRMAWRDSRRGREKLLLFLSSIAIGIAALVAIHSFNRNLRHDIDVQAKELLGADLVVSGSRPLPDSLLSLLASVPSQQARECSFASMVYFPKSKGIRLVQVRALEGNFPFYGKIETQPIEAFELFQQQEGALIDHTLLLQFNVAIGDSVAVGKLTFPVAGSLQKVPGQSGIVGTVAAPVYIPFAQLAATGLLQKGSRLSYRYYFRFEENTDVEALKERWETVVDRAGFNIETVESRKRSLGRAFDNLNRFLNLVAFVALLLGCVGVASSVHVYIAEKVPLVAVLRCMGATGWQAFFIYLLQIVLMGFIGALIGTALGAVLQTWLPFVFKNFLPLAVSTRLLPDVLGVGVAAGVLIALLFALPPLLRVRNISPLLTLRSSFEDNRKQDRAVWAVYALIGLFVAGFARLQLRSWTEVFWFIGGTAIAIALLATTAYLLMWALRKLTVSSLPYVWRQGFANLYRPQNQTLVLILSIGLGTSLIATLFFIQDLLLSQAQFAGRENQPNMVLFDIQSNQREQVNQLVASFKLPVLQQVPIVTMRISAVNGRSVQAIKADTASKIALWSLDREYRVTYRDTLIDSEQEAGGKWQGRAAETVFISFDESYAKRMGVGLGDRITFDVQGKLIETVIGHLRKVDFSRVQTNFVVLFPTGVLENAPQFHVLVTRVPNEQVSARFQQALVQKFPTVSVVDLGLILKTVDEVLDQVSFAIRFMAMLSILTGLLILASSVVISRYQRLKESVLLRTLGAVRHQILQINAVEYFSVGIIASLTGILLALIATWILSYFSFEMIFTPTFSLPVLTVISITTLTLLIGLWNSRAVINRPPLEVLRVEE
ncbi:MAG: FtsX-like permease family protein [Cytophagales bacterium]|nr:ABC transporter permease [Bernardetiaceae bacterium]MDW8206045.1 FtsX-like permease family protein [Cytophagales bacterium]